MKFVCPTKLLSTVTTKSSRKYSNYVPLVWTGLYSLSHGHATWSLSRPTTYTRGTTILRIVIWTARVGHCRTNIPTCRYISLTSGQNKHRWPTHARALPRIIDKGRTKVGKNGRRWGEGRKRGGGIWSQDVVVIWPLQLQNNAVPATLDLIPTVPTILEWLPAAP